MQLAKPLTDFEPVNEILQESLSVQAIATSIELKLFDYLEETPCTATTLAKQAGSVELLLEPLLDLLVARNLLSKANNQ